MHDGETSVGYLCNPGHRGISIRVTSHRLMESGRCVLPVGLVGDIQFPAQIPVCYRRRGAHLYFSTITEFYAKHNLFRVDTLLILN